ncbi:MAG: hypothetical protein EA402_05000 [Planctomycetota bacterium]|nr:MAG: hypothetical protein EA402_05000 [Planctomycetota bacterium]
MRRYLSLLAAMVLIGPLASAEFEEPFKVMIGNEPIDVPVGHAAPFMADMTGNGLPDLLVGQFGQGRVRLFPNVGEPGAPRFREWSYLEADGAPAAVRAG